MFKTLFHILAYLFSSYGVLTLVYSLVNLMLFRTGRKFPGIKLVLLVKNQENTVEGFIRNMHAAGFTGKLPVADKLAVIDMGSEDETPDILSILEKSCDIEVFGENEKERVFTYFKEIEPEH